MIKPKSLWLYLLFFIHVANQFQTSVKILRTDNGSEFTNHNCHKLFSSLGIVHQRIVSYPPQQNGRVERKHHLLQIARSLLFHSKLHVLFIHLWGHTILMAPCIINILPIFILNWETPFQKLHGKIPSYDNLKVFGCLYFATNITPHKRKFEQIPCVVDLDIRMVRKLSSCMICKKRK